MLFYRFHLNQVQIHQLLIICTLWTLIEYRIMIVIFYICNKDSLEQLTLSRTQYQAPIGPEWKSQTHRDIKRLELFMSMNIHFVDLLHLTTQKPQQSFYFIENKQVACADSAFLITMTIVKVFTCIRFASLDIRFGGQPGTSEPITHDQSTNGTITFIEAPC